MPADNIKAAPSQPKQYWHVSTASFLNVHQRAADKAECHLTADGGAAPIYALQAECVLDNIKSIIHDHAQSLRRLHSNREAPILNMAT